MSETNGSGKRDEAKFDGVVNELRNVLSGLGRTPPPPADRGPFDDPVPTSPDPLLSGPFAEAPASSTEPLASDADFWNGNVLNWPSNADADLPDAPPAMPTAAPASNGLLADEEAVIPPAPAANVFMPDSDALIPPAPSSNGFLLDDEPAAAGTRENPFSVDEPAPAAPSVFQPLDEEPAAPVSEAAPVQPQAQAPAPAPLLPPVPQAIEKTPDAWPVIKDDAEDLVPQPPAAPASAPAASEPAAMEPPAAAPATPPAAATSADPWLHAGMGMDAPFIEPKAAPAQAPKAAEPAAASGGLEFELPIPGTKETKDKPAAEQGPSLDLEGTELKPKDLVQIACVYPAGQEKAGQSFVAKLRDAGEKLRAPMNVQAVFVSGWTPDKVEPSAWAKSAQLSGADHVFVLSFRASAGLFKNLAADAAGTNTRARLVLIEQVNFPTLYADILVELKRAR